MYFVKELSAFRKPASIAYKIVLLSSISLSGERMGIHENNTIPATTYYRKRHLVSKKIC